MFLTVTPPDNALMPQVDATTSVTVSIVHDGTTTPTGAETIQVQTDQRRRRLSSLHFVLANSQGLLAGLQDRPIDPGIR